MVTLFIGLIVIVSILLILVVMVQNPKGGGLSSSFGGGNSSQMIGGVKKTGDFLDKSTWTLAILLVVLILVSNSFIKKSSLGVDTDDIPAVEAPVSESAGEVEINTQSAEEENSSSESNKSDSE